MKIAGHSQLLAAFIHFLRDDRSLVEVLESGIKGRSTNYVARQQSLGRNREAIGNENGGIHIRRLIIAE